MILPPDDRDQIDAEDIDWRAGLERRVGIISVLLIGLTGAATFVGSQSTPMYVFSIIMMIYSVLLTGLLSTHWVSRLTKMMIIITSLVVMAAMGYFLAGFLAGPALIVAFILVVAGLIFGRQTFIVMLLAFTSFLIALSIAVASGVWQGPNPIDFDPGDPKNWFRASLVTVIVWASLGSSILFVVNTVEENLARRRSALDRLQKETVERRAAEKARREAEAVANHAQKMEAVGQLAVGIAHDFNNALLVIQGWNEIRGQFDVDNEQQEATDAIARASEHTAQLSRQLLTFARKDIRTPKYLFLDQLAEEAVNTLRHVVGSSINVRLESQADRLVYVDESQFQQLIFNLVINARDALSGTGNIRVSVRDALASDIESFDSGGVEWIVLQVEDDGPGMDEETQERAFEPFFTTKDRGMGTGLGLSTVLGIVQQSGGHIDLKSLPGRTTFSLFLPAADIERYDVPVISDSIETIRLGLRTLLLEDDTLAREMIASVLRRNGNDVLECDNGDAALSLLKDDPGPFDLLCSDAVFPGASLGSVLEAFERHSPAAKVMICSGYVQEELAIRKLESGEYTFFAKPFTGTRLIAKIHEIIGDVNPLG